MKKTLLASIILFHSLGTTAQNCFEKCLDDYRNSKLDVPMASQSVLSQLVGCNAPAFSATTMAGEKLTLGELKGKIVVVNFWFAGCQPCVAEIPALNRLAREYSKQDVVFIGFSRDGLETTRKFLQTKNFDYQIVADADFMSDKYCVIGGWPMNMVIDKNGVVRELFSGGFVDERAATHAYEKMKPVIEKYLKETNLCRAIAPRLGAC